MTRPSPRRFLLWLLAGLISMGAILPASPATATTPAPNDSAGATDTPSPKLIPPFADDDPPRPMRTRQDRVVSAIAPIAMVAVLAAGLYIYWLIRKGL